MTDIAPLQEIRSELNRLFDSYFREPWSISEPMARTEFMPVPAIDLSETDNAITIRAEVPGMEQDDIDASVSGNVLTISGEKREEKESREENYHHIERRHGSFRRSIELPDNADIESVEAELKNGILTIHVAKSAIAESRHIAVKGAKGEKAKATAGLT